MRPIYRTAFTMLIVSVGVSACDNSAAISSRAEPLPVVKVPPVETRPFEDGYAIGFVSGKAAGRPRAVLPTTEEIEVQALQEAAADPQRAAKWQRGWASGYLDGFRQSSEGVK